MEFSSIKCRKCRGLLADSDCLSTKCKNVKQERETRLEPEDTLSYIDWESSNAPKWVLEALSQTSFQRGKLNCPHCGGRLGSFDFVSHTPCECGEHSNPPVHLSKCRLDFVQSASPINIRGVATAFAMANAEHTTKIRCKRKDPNEIGQQSSPCLNTALHEESSEEDACDNEDLADNVRNPHKPSSTRERSQRAAACQDSLPSICDTSFDNLTSLAETLGSSISSAVAVAGQSLQSVAGRAMNEERLQTDAESDTCSTSDGGEISQVDEEVIAEIGQQSQHERDGSSGSRFTPLGSGDHSDGTEQEDISTSPGVGGCVLRGDVDALTCPICLELYYLPYTCHPCLHVFCSPCLRRLRGTQPINTKCPLCREVICACLPDHNLTDKVKSDFPEEFRRRRVVEKKSSRRLPPLPSSNDRFAPISAQLRRARNRGNNLVLVHLAGVCFVTMLVMLAMCVLITTVSFVLWYLWEVFMEYGVDLFLLVNDFFDKAWTGLLSLLFEGHISAQEAKILLGSFGQLLYAMGKFYNQTHDKLQELRETGFSGSEAEKTLNRYFPPAVQTDIANYFMVMCLVTFFIYRLARHMLHRQQAEAAQNRRDDGGN